MSVSQADPGGRADAGSSYIIYGGPQFVSGAYALGTGTAASELVLGTVRADTLTCGGEVDRFSAGAGNDTIVLSSTDVTKLASNTPAAIKAFIDGGSSISGATQTYSVWNHNASAAQMLKDADITRQSVI